MPFEVQGPITYDASRLYFPKASEFKTGASLDTLNHVVISFVKSKEFQAYLHTESSGSNRLQIDARVIKDHIFVKINGREEKEFSLTTKKVERTANRILDEAKKVWEEKDSSLTDRSIQHLVMAPLTAKDPQVARLKREIAQLKQQLASTESNPRRQATDAIEMDRLQEALARTSLEAYQLETANRELKINHAHLVSERDALRTGLGSLEARSRDELEASRSSFESALASKTATIQSLESQLASLEEAHGLDSAASRLQITALRHQLGSVKASKEDLARQAANLTSQNEILTSANGGLSSALDESRATSAREKSDFETRIAQLTSTFTKEKSRLEGLIGDLRTQNEGLLSTIDEKQAQLTALELQQAATASALTSSKALSAQEKTSHEEALSTLQSSIAALREELKAAKASAEERNGQIISLAADLAEKEMAHETALTLQAETLRQEHRSSLEKEKKALVFADRMTRSVWHLAYTKEILELRHDLEELIATTEAKKDEARRKKEALEKEYEKKEAAALEKQHSQIASFQAHIESLTRQITALERQLTLLRIDSLAVVKKKASSIVDFASFISKIADVKRQNPALAFLIPRQLLEIRHSIPRPIAMKVEKALLTDKPIHLTGEDIKKLRKILPQFFMVLENSIIPHEKSSILSLALGSAEKEPKSDRLRLSLIAKEQDEHLPSLAMPDFPLVLQARNFSRPNISSQAGLISSVTRRVLTATPTTTAIMQPFQLLKKVRPIGSNVVSKAAALALAATAVSLTVEKRR